MGGEEKGEEGMREKGGERREISPLHPTSHIIQGYKENRGDGEGGGA